MLWVLLPHFRNAKYRVYPPAPVRIHEYEKVPVFPVFAYSSIPQQFLSSPPLRFLKERAGAKRFVYSVVQYSFSCPFLHPVIVHKMNNYITHPGGYIIKVSYLTVSSALFMFFLPIFSSCVNETYT